MGDASGFVTKRGRVMRFAVRRRLIKVMGDPANDYKTKREQAALVGMGLRTMADYMTEEVVAEIARARRGQVEVHDLLEVDRAMLEKARDGNVNAARLIYTRIAGMRMDDDEEVPTLEEDTSGAAMVLRLDDLIADLQKQVDAPAGG